jgi:hypothetical protein
VKGQESDDLADRRGENAPQKRTHECAARSLRRRVPAPSIPSPRSGKSNREKSRPHRTAASVPYRQSESSCAHSSGAMVEWLHTHDLTRTARKRTATVLGEGNPSMTQIKSPGEAWE